MYVFNKTDSAPQTQPYVWFEYFFAKDLRSEESAGRHGALKHMWRESDSDAS